MTPALPTGMRHADQQTSGHPAGPASMPPRTHRVPYDVPRSPDTGGRSADTGRDEGPGKERYTAHGVGHNAHNRKMKATVCDTGHAQATVHCRTHGRDCTPGQAGRCGLPLSPQPVGAAGGLAALPQPGPALAGYLAGYRPGGFTPPEVLLPRIEQALAPMPHAMLHARVYDFAEILNAGVANPLPGVALELRSQALLAVCSDLPAAVWVGTVWHDALCQFRFFPSAAEVRDFLHGRCAALYGMAACLRLMLAQAGKRT